MFLSYHPFDWRNLPQKASPRNLRSGHCQARASVDRADCAVNVKLTITVASLPREIGHRTRKMAETVHVIRRPYTALAIILALGLAVAACDFGPPPPPAPPVAAAEPEPAPTLPSPPPRKPAPARSPVVANLPPEASGERTSLPEERALEPAPEVTPATQAGSFDRLIGLDQPHVT